jgi:hypothetical protein
MEFIISNFRKKVVFGYAFVVMKIVNTYKTSIIKILIPLRGGRSQVVANRCHWKGKSSLSTLAKGSRRKQRWFSKNLETIVG